LAHFDPTLSKTKIFQQFSTGQKFGSKRALTWGTSSVNVDKMSSYTIESWMLYRQIDPYKTNYVINATFLGVAPQAGGYDPQIRNQSRYVYEQPTTQVSSSYVNSFGNYRADKHTGKPTNKQTNGFWQKHQTFFAMLRDWVENGRKKQVFLHLCMQGSPHEIQTLSTSRRQTSQQFNGNKKHCE